MVKLAVAGILFALASLASAQWEAEDSGTKSNLRGIHNAGSGAVWASGANGAVLRSEDDGYLWQQCKAPPDASKLDFRGVWAWDANRALVMSSGHGASSRLYETTDGCAHWNMIFTNPDASGFWDAIAFSDERHGMLLGDPVNNRFTIWRTTDRGEHWSRDNSAELATLAGQESAFAASNSALFLNPDGDAYFGTGGPSGARIFHLRAGHWSSVTVNSMRGAESSGVFSLAFAIARMAWPWEEITNNPGGLTGQRRLHRMAA